MKIARNIVPNKGLVWIITLLIALGCSTSRKPALVSSYQLLPVDESYTADSLTEATIAPYREQLMQEMDLVIGHSKKRLVEGPVESPLGNFVADAILSQSEKYYADKIDLSLMNNGGLRAPIPEGPVKISNIYELMPFENLLYILELDGQQTLELFKKMAGDQRLAIGNSVVIIEDHKPVKIFIDGAPFTENKKYTLAVSDYLAQGGGGMDFLKEARVMATAPVKIRDLIIAHIKELEARGIPIEAEIEGRVKLLP